MKFFSKLFGKRDSEKSQDVQNNAPAWRSADGKIACPGKPKNNAGGMPHSNDAGEMPHGGASANSLGEANAVPNEGGCRIACDEGCPLHCLQLASERINAKNYTEAERLLQRAVALEPELSQAWALMGNCRRAVRDSNGAYEYYKKAYDLGLHSEVVIYGLYEACLRTFRLLEMMKYCEEYAAFDEAKSFKMRLKCFEFRRMTAPDISKNTPYGGAQQLPPHLIEVMKLLHDQGQKLELTTRQIHTAGITDIENGTYEVLRRISEYYPTVNLRAEANLKIYAMTAFYAGMAAVHIWGSDHRLVQKVGIANAIFSLESVNKIDQWVLGKIFRKPDYIKPLILHPIRGKVNELAITALHYLIYYYYDRSTPVTKIDPIVNDGMIAMYLFGMQCQMQRCGIF